MTDEESAARLRELKRRIAELRARLPRHSPPTAMLVELDELEDEVARLEKRQEKARSKHTTHSA